MLILTRRVGETIKIGPDIEVTVVKTDGSQISIGIRAPRDVLVLRAELGPLTASPRTTAKPD